MPGWSPVHDQIEMLRLAVVSTVSTASAFLLVAGGLPSSSSSSSSPRCRAPTVTSCAAAAAPKQVSDMRKEYSEQPLLEADVPADPYTLFAAWFDEACAAGAGIEPNAMCLSTVSPDTHRPSARYVLLKGHDDRGFVWYTNYGSRKSNDLAATPFAALTFWWGDLERSVRLEGAVEKVSEEESAAYFYSRPRTSQIGAWSSNQSTEISGRAALEAQEAEVEKRFADADVIPKPPHWGGFRLVPDRVEFWKGRASRLHDRLAYTKVADDPSGAALMSKSTWSIARLQP